MPISRESTMPSFIRHPKDFWTGVIFLFVGLAAVILGRDYTMGTAGRMGTAYFPTVLGGLLALIGLVAVVRSFPLCFLTPWAFLSCVFFLVVGLPPVISGPDYTMGSAGIMWPAYFTTFLGGLLALIALVAVVLSFYRKGEPIGSFAVLETLLIISAVLLFGFLVRGA